MAKAGIVAFAFGVPDTILSNQRIALITCKIAREVGGSVYTQRDVRVEPGIEVEYTQEEPNNPSPTLRIARGAVRWARRKAITHLFVVAAVPHLWRAKRDLKKAVQEAGMNIKVLACSEVYAYPEDEWFCLDSTQERSRSREAWEKRESILKLMPFFIYKYIAS